MNTTKAIAQALNGVQYPADRNMPREVLDAAKAAGIVIMYGNSDDLVEFEGAFHDEEGAWEGATVYMTPEGPLKNECDDEHCQHCAKIKASATPIMLLWCDGPESPAWTIKTDIPHETFDIVEDGEVQSRGIVFKLADVTA